MKTFTEISFDRVESRCQIDEFGQLLENYPSLGERKDLLPFCRARPQLAARIGPLNSTIVNPDRLAFEYDLFGDFTCDLVVGDSRRMSYTFIEFEDARHNSVFSKRTRKSTPEWSSRFDHGYSQIIDWFWKLRDLERTHDFEARFGHRIEYNVMLIIGRGHSFGSREDRRWLWRQRSVVVDSKHVICLTYDQLHEALDLRLANRP